MTTPTPGGYQAIPQVSLEWLSRGFNYFSARAGDWIGLSLIAILAIAGIYAAIAVPAGLLIAAGHILHNPGAYWNTQGFMPSTRSASDDYGGFVDTVVGTVVSGGIYRAALKQIRGGDFAIGELFNISDVFLQLILLGLIIATLSTVAVCFCCYPYFIVLGLLMFAPLFVVDMNMNALQAVSASFNILQREWPMASFFAFATAIFNLLGLCCMCVGALVTYPVSFIAVAYGYCLFTGSSTTAPSPFQPGGSGEVNRTPTAVIWPPPPTVPGSEPPTASQASNDQPSGYASPIPPSFGTLPATERPAPAEDESSQDFTPRQPRPPLNGGPSDGSDSTPT
jgi:hypothetical protein